jgi:beta-galactosidase
MIYPFARLLFVLFILTLSIPLISQSREITTLQSCWKFAQGTQTDAFKPEFKDAFWQTVSVPHDWAISDPFNPDSDGIQPNFHGKEKDGTGIQ